MTPVSVIRCAGALGRNHRRTQRRLRSAQRAKRLAVVRFFNALQDLTADAVGRLLGVDSRHVEPPLRVVLAELLAQPVAASGDGTDAAPLAVTHLEDAERQRLGVPVAFTSHGAGVLVLD